MSEEKPKRRRPQFSYKPLVPLVKTDAPPEPVKPKRKGKPGGMWSKKKLIPLSEREE